MNITKVNPTNHTEDLQHGLLMSYYEYHYEYNIYYGFTNYFSYSDSVILCYVIVLHDLNYLP
jgi:hypothetical protein